MALSDDDIKASQDFLKLFTEAHWDGVTAEKAIHIYRAIAWLQRIITEIGNQKQADTDAS